jgi:hypothetical protein
MNPFLMHRNHHNNSKMGNPDGFPYNIRIEPEPYKLEIVVHRQIWKTIVQALQSWDMV